MTKPVTPQDMFELWQKMVNPTGYPLQSLMFPVLDAKEIEKKIGELQVVEHWLRANLGMLQVSIKSLEYQRALLKGGAKFSEALREGQPLPAAGGQDGEPAPNPAMWGWDVMAKAGQDAMKSASPAAAPRKPRKAKRR
jgi:hypothetical protein